MDNHSTTGQHGTTPARLQQLAARVADQVRHHNSTSETPLQGPPVHQLSFELAAPLSDWLNQATLLRDTTKRQLVEHGLQQLPTDTGTLQRLISGASGFLDPDMPSNHHCLRIGDAGRTRLQKLRAVLQPTQSPHTLRAVVTCAIAIQTLTD